MQTAYNKYKYASDLLKAAPSDMPAPISSEDEAQRITILAVEQRAAFESYIEARLQYAEFERDLGRVTTADSTIAQSDHQAEVGRGMGIRFRGPVVAVVGIALVGVVALSFAFIMREIKPRDPVPVPLSQDRGDLGSVAGKLRGSDAPPMSTPGTIVDPQPSQATGKIARKEQPSRLRSHSYYEFTLTPSRKFKQVGPVSISLRGIDSRRQILDLLVKQEGSKPAKMRVRLKKPIWVTEADGFRRIELVATQIQKNRVRGFLNESKSYKLEVSWNRRAGGYRGKF